MTCLHLQMYFYFTTYQIDYKIFLFQIFGFLI